jgi:hypothetical protein
MGRRRWYRRAGLRLKVRLRLIQRRAATLAVTVLASPAHCRWIALMATSGTFRECRPHRATSQCRARCPRDGKQVPQGSTGTVRSPIAGPCDKEAAWCRAQFGKPPDAVVESLFNRTSLVNDSRGRRRLPPPTLRDMMVGTRSIGGGKSFYGPIRSDPSTHICGR